jgi:antitoxin component YwqK of YwqJK toxin-antitoxin module
MGPIWSDRDRIDRELRAVDYSELDYDPDLGLQCYDGEPFTGNCTQRYPDGRLESVVQMVRGLNGGVTVAWHPNGQIASYGELQDGLRHGLLIEWDEHGTKVVEKRYFEDRLVRS